MLMIDRAKEVARCDLANIATPQATKSWRPVGHHEAVETLMDRAIRRGLSIRAERYALLDGASYPRSGDHRPMPGARLFGSLDFDPAPGIPFPVGVTPSMGIRNSHDKSFSLSILAGARVLICANGVLSAEFVVTRKHTSGLNLKVEIDKALDLFIDSLTSFRNSHDRLRNHRLSVTRAHSLIVEMARSGAIASSQILPVANEFESPRHQEFREHNAWNLHQAATELMKCQSPSRQLQGFKALKSVFDEIRN